MAEANSSPSPSSSKGPLIVQILVVVLNLGGMGAGLFMAYQGTLGWQAPQVTEAELASLAEAEMEVEKEPIAPLIYTMDKFTVNLAGEPKRTIRVEVNLEMLNKEGFEEVIDRDNRARARDKIVQILNGRTYSDLEPIQGKLFLKDQIAMDLNAILDKGVVKDVYFSEFIVQ